jgi:hypothetical protein
MTSRPWSGFLLSLQTREDDYDMSECSDPYLEQLGEEMVAARRAEVPDLNEVRATKDRFITYLARCVLDEMDRMDPPEPSGPRLDVISNDGPVRRNPRRMSSPMKTAEIRAFELEVNRVFGTNAVATTEWPTGSPS